MGNARWDALQRFMRQIKFCKIQCTAFTDRCYCVSCRAGEGAYMGDARWQALRRLGSAAGWLIAPEEVCMHPSS